MAKLGRFDWTVTDSAGNALSGVSVTLRKQGATVNGAQSGTAPFPVTVNDPGGAINGDTIRVNTGTTDYNTAPITPVGPTTITLRNFSGTLALSDRDRLTISGNLPSIYSDAEGSLAITNPLTTSSLGEVTCWIKGGYYDVLVSGGSSTTTLYQDMWIGAESESANEFDAASAVGFIRDTARSLSTAGALLEDWRNSGDSKYKIGYDGTLTATGSGKFYGNASASGVYTASVVSTNYTGTGLSGFTGAVTTAMLAANAITASFYLASGTNASATVASGTTTRRASVTWTPSSGNVGAIVLAKIDHDWTAAAGGSYGIVDLTVNGNLRSRGSPGGNLATAPGHSSTCLFWGEAALATSTVATAEIGDSRTTDPMAGVYKGNIDPARILVVELKR